MSLLSSIILPILEKELIALEPSIAQFVINQLEAVGSEVMAWIESKGKPAAKAKPNNSDWGAI